MQIITHSGLCPFEHTQHYNVMSSRWCGADQAKGMSQFVSQGVTFPPKYIAAYTLKVGDHWYIQTTKSY